MSITGSVITHSALGAASDAFWENEYRKWRPKAEAEVIEYCMLYVERHIADKDEREWIRNNELVPEVQKMTENELGKILKMRDKNKKLIKKNKPIKYVPIPDDEVRAAHLKYLSFKKRKATEFEMGRKRREAEAKAQTIQARKAIARRKYVYENGESDEEIAAKFF